METTSVVFRVKDVKAYRQLGGRDWWCAIYDDPSRSCSWQPTAYLGDVPPPIKAKMSDMKKRWLSRQMNKYRLLVLILWVGALAALAMTGYLLAKHWETLFADPDAWQVLYTLTLPVWSWGAICGFLSVLLAALAIRVQSKVLPHYQKRGTRSLKGFVGAKRLAGGEPPKPTRIQPLRQCKHVEG
ncbi:conserved hypothetical protein [Neospora caninum Liverpool]|uniref:Transmembrane protein n=1 Tax=Neospora caninum (strain Liverpool) TaxID=572307 RepID=F0VLF4_NEOCL|nr:conserved hypothetical protein [Neospora caninum Liverpool]CBZ54082.1 conserved hypothetical protein [Neospora caninum Liverpool]CEL68778.1 TPA: hypothetical protein BN1204_045150 [Neospora caninum Liverpool]|eukprot:XP_003884113.1 conserved hypothetical protein [Neospora caninum Liverpool]